MAALSTHVALIVGAERNTNRKGEGGVSCRVVCMDVWMYVYSMRNKDCTYVSTGSEVLMRVCMICMRY